MQFENKQLLQFLGEVDSILPQKITLTAVGGTAMTLLKIKTSTIDIDFEFRTNTEKEAFQKAEKILGSGFRFDLYVNGQIFSQQLPDGFRKKTIPVKTGLKNIALFALHPLDIVVTKIGRLNERDEQDIADCIKKFGLTKKQIKERASKVVYTGNPKNYEHNLQTVLAKF